MYQLIVRKTGEVIAHFDCFADAEYAQFHCVYVPEQTYIDYERAKTTTEVR